MYSCLEHIEEAMDRYLDEYGKLPILVEVELSHSCDYCKQEAVYKIIEGMMIEDEEDFQEIELAFKQYQEQIGGVML